MNKQTSIIIYMMLALIFTSVVLISKSTISRLDLHNKTFSQQISNLQSKMISLSSTLQPANKINPANPTDYKLSRSIVQLTNKLAQQDKKLVIINQEIQSTLTHLKRIDSSNQLTSNEQVLSVQRDKPLTNNNKRLDEADLKARQVALQARKYAEFHSEMVDTAWSDATQNELMMLFDQRTELVGANLTDYQCRTSSCEISWKIDNNLDDFERFELENNILVELARIGLDSVMGISTTASDPGSNKMIAKSSQRPVSQK